MKVPSPCEPFSEHSAVPSREKKDSAEGSPENQGSPEPLYEPKVSYEPSHEGWNSVETACANGWCAAASSSEQRAPIGSALRLNHPDHPKHATTQIVLSIGCKPNRKCG